MHRERALACGFELVSPLVSLWFDATVGLVICVVGVFTVRRQAP